MALIRVESTKVRFGKRLRSVWRMWRLCVCGNRTSVFGYCARLRLVAFRVERGGSGSLAAIKRRVRRIRQARLRLPIPQCSELAMALCSNFISSAINVQLLPQFCYSKSLKLPRASFFRRLLEKSVAIFVFLDPPFSCQYVYSTPPSLHEGYVRAMVGHLKFRVFPPFSLQPFIADRLRSITRLGKRKRL